MTCPYCSTPLSPTEVHTKSDQIGEIHECFNCGGHWFPRWLANDITISEASNVDAITPTTVVQSPSQPRCPVCQTRLALIAHDPVPRGITVFTCPQGHGNFFPKGQLLQFKKAQDAKITYHTLWGIPLKSIFSVMLPVVAVLTIVSGLPLLVSQLQEATQETRTKASSLHSRPIVTQINPSDVIISFTSQTSLITSVSLYEDNQLLLTQIISSSPQTTHQIILRDLNSNFPYNFVINSTNPSNQQTITSERYPIIFTQKKP